MADVGTTKLFENDRVIVWEMTLPPGANTGIHTHNHTYFFQVLEGSTLNTLVDGESVGEFEFPTGSTHFLDRDGDELVYGDLRVSATHDAQNIGDTPYREILVELK